MTVYLLITLAFMGLIAALMLCASKHGSKAAQLEALKAELKKQAREQERAKKIKDTVYSLSIDDARRRLHDVANKQR